MYSQAMTSESVKFFDSKQKVSARDTYQNCKQRDTLLNLKKATLFYGRINNNNESKPFAKYNNDEYNGFTLVKPFRTNFQTVIQPVNTE